MPLDYSSNEMSLEHQVNTIVSSRGVRIFVLCSDDFRKTNMTRLLPRRRQLSLVWLFKGQ